MSPLVSSARLDDLGSPAAGSSSSHLHMGVLGEGFLDGFIGNLKASGEYNSLGLLLAAAAILWTLKILWRFFLSADVLRQIKLLSSTSSGVLTLDGMAAFTKDFRRLQRSHFNQILRVKKTVPPVAVPRVVVPAAIDSSSVSLFVDPEVENVCFWNNRGRRYGVTCQVKNASSGKASVQLYWGVSVSVLKEMFRLTPDDFPGLVVRVDPLNSISGGFSRLLNSRRMLRGSDAAAGESARSLLEMEELDERSGQSYSSIRDFSSSITPAHYIHRSSVYEFGVGLNQVFRTSPSDMYDIGALIDFMEASNRPSGSTSATSPVGSERAEDGERRTTATSGSSSSSSISSATTAGNLGRTATGADGDPESGGNASAETQPTTVEEATEARLLPRVILGDAKIPLVIVVTSRKKSSARELGTLGELPIAEGFCEVSLARLRSEGQDNYSVDVVKQVVLCGGTVGPQEAQDVYGLEDERERDCLICMTNAKDTMFLPCRHCSLCYECLRSLRQERCPICRTNFSSFITFPVKRPSASTPSSSSANSTSAATSRTAAGSTQSGTSADTSSGEPTTSGSTINTSEAASVAGKGSAASASSDVPL